MRWIFLLAVVLAAVALCVPAWQARWFDNDEGTSYIARTVEYADALERGELYPRWCPNFYSGYGSPFFVFYAPLVYAFAASLTLLLGSAALALKVVSVLASVLAGAGTFALVRLETQRADAALLAAATYLAAPYRILDWTRRGDLAEFTALALLPVVLFAYRRVFQELDPARLPGAATFAALAHAALIMTHTLLGLWGTGLVALVVGCSLMALGRRRDFLRSSLLVSAFAAALLASSVYTLPALVERSLVRTADMGLGGYATSVNWVPFRALVEAEQFRVAPQLVAAALVVAAASLWRRRALPLATTLLLSALAFSVLTLPHASTLWSAGVIPFGDLLQFPWRLLGPALLCAAVALGVGWAQLTPRHPLATLAAVLVAVLAYAEAWKFAAVAESEARLPDNAAKVRAANLSTTGVDEYLPRAVERQAVRVAGPVARSTPKAHVVSQSSQGNDHQMEVEATAVTSLPLALHHYPGWAVQTLSGPAPAVLLRDGRGLVALDLPRAGHYRLRVHFGSTPTRDAAAALSLLTILALPFAFGNLTRRALTRRSEPPAPHPSQVLA